MVDRNSQLAVRPFFCKRDSAKVLGSHRPTFQGSRAPLPTALPHNTLGHAPDLTGYCTDPSRGGGPGASDTSISLSSWMCSAT